MKIDGLVKSSKMSHCERSEAILYFRIISNLVEKKTGFLSEKDLFSVGSANREDSLWPNGSMPGQKSIRLAKKGGDPFFPDAGFRRFSPGIPFPPRLFAETKRKELGRVLPALFCLRRLLSCPGNKETGLNDQLNWR
jgi:hypothetical protein